MSHFIGPISNEIINLCINEVKKSETKEKIISGVVEPILNESMSRYKKHLSSFIFIHLVIIILLVYIIFLLNNKVNVIPSQQLIL